MSCELCQRKLIVCRHCQQSSEEWRKEGRKIPWKSYAIRDTWTECGNCNPRLRRSRSVLLAWDLLIVFNCMLATTLASLPAIPCRSPSLCLPLLPFLHYHPSLPLPLCLPWLALLPLLHFSISAGILWRHYCPAKTEVLKPFFLSLCLHCCASHPLLCFPSLSLSLSLCLALPHLCCLYFS